MALLGSVVAAQAFGGEPPVEATLARLRAERARQLERLEEYRKRGVFPAGFEVEAELAPDDPHAEEGRVHAFIAPNGALCPVAHLMAASGRRDLVDRIARESNDLCIALTADPEVHTWVLSSGL